MKPVAQVLATPAAVALIERIVAAHGPMLFHQSGGCCDGSAPMCYPRDEFVVGEHDRKRFDFLGYTFRPRRSVNRNGKLFVSFAPAVSAKAAKAMLQRIRRWKLHLRNDLGLQELAQWTRPVLTGWVQYYGRSFPSALHRALRTLNRFLVRWAQRKYQRLRGHEMRAWDWLNALRAREPSLFAHWGLASSVGR